MLSLRGGAGNGQSLEDKLYAIKYFISGQGISFVVLKATTSELLGPKKKHLTYLVAMTNEPNVSIPSLAKYLMQRALHPDWSVAFKSLITIHHLMSYGNEKFLQNLASSTVNDHIFDHLSLFNDKSTSIAYDMSIYVRRYSRYVASKIKTYRLLGMDFCKMKPNGLIEPSLRMRSASLDQLMTILPALQDQFDSLIAFDANERDLKNAIINAAFSSLYKDFVKLYIAYQSAIIRLLKLYFTVSKVKRAQELLEVYRKFLVRMDKMGDYLRVIDMVGINKTDLPHVSKWPSISLKKLEDYANQLESPNKLRRASKGPYDTMVGACSPVIYPKLLYSATNTGSRRQSLKRSTAIPSSGLDSLKKCPPSSSKSTATSKKSRTNCIEALELNSNKDEDETRAYCDIDDVEKASMSWSSNKTKNHSAFSSDKNSNQENEEGTMFVAGTTLTREGSIARQDVDDEINIKIEMPDLMLLDDEPLPDSIAFTKDSSLGPTNTTNEAELTSSLNKVQVELL